MFGGQWGARRWGDLVGCVLADKYLILKCLEAVRGSCGCPFICENIETKEQVFVKILDGSDYTLNREVAEVDSMVRMGLRHKNLVEMIEVLKNSTVVKRASGNQQGSGEVFAQGCTAIVSENAPGGDLFDYLFAPIHTGRPKPCSFPEPIARHFIRHLIDGVLFLHGHEIYHRDLKPENFVFDESYNAKITDFGMNSFTPTEVTEFPRALTMHVPTGDKTWTVGTEAYAPPEVRGAADSASCYDPAQYDVWSIGLVLLMMLGVDKLEIVTHQLMRGNQMVKEKVVRMPFVGYRTTVGDRPNMLPKLDSSPPGFTGSMEQKCPEHRAFWNQFPALASSLSDSARDLLNRVFIKEPVCRITLSEMLKHPWFKEATSLTPDIIKKEMMARQPNKAQTGTNQVVYLGGASDAGISQAELRRYMKLGEDADRGGDFPRDSLIESNLGFFDCGPAGEYSAAKLFAGLSQAVTSWGLLQPEGMLSKSMLLLTAHSDREYNNSAGEEFQVEVFASEGRIKVLIRNFPVSTQWSHWREEIGLFCENYRMMLEGSKKPPAPASSLAEVKTTTMNQTTPMEVEEALPQDWWPECTQEEQQQYRLLWSMFGQPADGHLRRDMFMRYMERTSGLQPVETEAVWHLVVPPSSQSMKQQQFVQARYLITRLLEGRTLPPKFPTSAFTDPGSPDAASSTALSQYVGTKEHPFRYDTFAYLFRPLLEAEYRKNNRVWRKFAPVAVFCPKGSSPFQSGMVSDNSKKWTVCNICTPQMESWGMKSANLISNYTSPDVDSPIALSALQQGNSPESLKNITMEVASSMRVELFKDFSSDTWERMQSVLRELTLKDGGTTEGAWRLAVPTNTVVAQSLSPEEAPDLLKRLLGAVGISYFGGALYREETYKAAEEFGPDYYLVSDVAPSLNLWGMSDLMPGRAVTHDQRWVW
eukprot:CAMPEP_0196600790 /NCGR_PEP_ID=MMETSP1081-20130531/95571_1 /TAXON_ID=36882 /ORGANISM="Pyramimonas amylifera, Strain CCMP720" /LENGTH=928 /DNA_ID=CAMNT_0041926645 /DNA_START=509 /DNA_END=3292 /DNA_ORIENTATION=-